GLGCLRCFPFSLSFLGACAPRGWVLRRPPPGRPPPPATRRTWSTYAARIRTWPPRQLARDLELPAGSPRTAGPNPTPAEHFRLRCGDCGDPPSRPLHPPRTLPSPNRRFQLQWFRSSLTPPPCVWTTHTPSPVPT